MSGQGAQRLLLLGKHFGLEGVNPDRAGNVVEDPISPREPRIENARLVVRNHVARRSRGRRNGHLLASFGSVESSGRSALPVR